MGKSQKTRTVRIEHMSKAVRDLNPELARTLAAGPLEIKPLTEAMGAALVQSSLERAAQAILPAKRKRKRRRQMNKTEAAFARLLEARASRGEIASWDFESMTLRWGLEEVFAYTPDFVVVENIHRHEKQTHVSLVFIEVKGRQIWTKDSDRFRHARDNFTLYRFEMWQLVKGDWTQIR